MPPIHCSIIAGCSKINALYPRLCSTKLSVIGHWHNYSVYTQKLIVYEFSENNIGEKISFSLINFSINKILSNVKTVSHNKLVQSVTARDMGCNHGTLIPTYHHQYEILYNLKVLRYALEYYHV